MKHLFFKIAAFSIFSFLVMVSETSSYLKIILVSAMLFFFLPFGNDLFTKERMWRKFTAAVSGTVLFTVLMLIAPSLLSGNLTNLIDSIGSADSFGYVLLVFAITLFYFLIYGLPVSLLSDWL